MPGDDDFASGEIETTITFMFAGIAEKDATGGTGREFVGDGVG